MRSFYNTLLVSLLAAQVSMAASSELTKVNLEKDLEKLSAKNLYDLDPKVKESSLSSLSRMKYFEIKKRWKECGALGGKTIRANSEIQAWVAASWLKCEIKNTEDAKDKKSLNKPVEWLRRHKELLQTGPWKKSLWRDYIAANMTLLETRRTPAKVNELLEYTSQLPNDALATLLAYAGEYAEKKARGFSSFKAASGPSARPNPRLRRRNFRYR